MGQQGPQDCEFVAAGSSLGVAPSEFGLEMRVAPCTEASLSDALAWLPMLTSCIQGTSRGAEMMTEVLYESDGGYKVSPRLDDLVGLKPR